MNDHPYQDYTQIDAINHSGLKYLEQSPAHYRVWRKGLLASKQTEAQSFGIAAHCAILEPERFEAEYACLPDTSECATPAQKATLTRSAKKEYAYSDKRFLSFEDYHCILSMRESAFSHPFVQFLLEDSFREWVHQWVDLPSGAACKGRTDIWIPRTGVIADIKTVVDISDTGLAKSAATYQWHRQAAFYLDGLEASYFMVLALERQPPFSVRVLRVPEHLISIGRRAYQPLCQIYQQCVLSGEWPGYSLNTTPLSLPAYAIPEVLPEIRNMGQAA